MKLVYQCDYCSYKNEDYKVENHEIKCDYNPNNKTCLTCTYYIPDIEKYEILTQSGIRGYGCGVKYCLYKKEALPDILGFVVEEQEIIKNCEFYKTK